MRTPLSMKPTGWFQVGWSADFGPKAVVPLRYFGEDLAAYRDPAGEMHVQSAYCQHLGANLAYGGCVTDDGIQCPFHGWEWGHDGRNVRIPYQDRPNKARRLTTWPVVERNDSIYLWHDIDGDPPTWEVPDLRTFAARHLAEREFYPVVPSRFTNLQVHPQVVAENAVDPHHFRFVHGTAASPVVLEQKVDDFSWRSVVGFGRRWAGHTGPRTSTLNTLELIYAGLGTSLNVEHTADGVRIITINVVPVDNDTTELFAGYWLDRGPGDDTARFERRLAEAMAALPDDIQIWDHQKYLESPALATSEAAGFQQLRRWAKGFYPNAETA